MSTIHGFYINLDSRTDRKKHFEQFKSQYPTFKHVNRFPAVYHPIGYIGVGMSQIKVLEKILKLDCDYGILFEDDFMIFNATIFKECLKDFEKIKHLDCWDVITFSPFFSKK